MVWHYLDEIDRWKQVITGFDARIARLLADLEQDLASLVTIPEIGRLGAEIIIAETGGDMTQFASAHRPSSQRRHLLGSPAAAAPGVRRGRMPGGVRPVPAPVRRWCGRAGASGV